MIVSEAFALGLLGILVGYFITLVFAIPMTLIGIDYGGMEFAEVTIREPIYYEFFWYQVIAYPLLILGFTVLVSFYPAFHAIRLTMAKAIKRTL